MAPADFHSSPSSEPGECPALVLVIDDDDSVRRVTVKILERYRYRATGAATVEEAMQILEELPAPVGAVVLDWSLPGLCGTAAVEALLDRHPDLCLVVVTGWAQTVEDALAARWGHVPVIHKPFEPDHLVDVLSQQGLSTA